MRITGKNLHLLHYALHLAEAELHNQIVTCPDVELYAEDVESLEKDRADVIKLRKRVEKHLGIVDEDQE